MKTRKMTLVSLVITITGVLLFSLSVFPQSGPKIDVSPLGVNLNVTPGKKHTGRFSVTNRSQEKVTAKIDLYDFTLSETGAIQTLPPGANDRSLARYIDYSPNQVTLKPGKGAWINYSFTLPKDEVGPRWAVLMVTTGKAESFSSAPQKTEEEGEEVGLKVDLRYRFAVTVIQRSPQLDVAPKGKILTINTKSKVTDKNSNSVTIGAVFKNISEVIADCSGYIELRDSTGKKVDRYTIPKEAVVFPKTERVFSHTFESEKIEPGRYLALAVIDFGGQNMVGGQKMVTVEDE